MLAIHCLPHTVGIPRYAGRHVSSVGPRNVVRTLGCGKIPTVDARVRRTHLNPIPYRYEVTLDEAFPSAACLEDGRSGTNVPCTESSMSGVQCHGLEVSRVCDSDGDGDGGENVIPCGVP